MISFSLTFLNRHSLIWFWAGEMGQCDRRQDILQQGSPCYGAETELIIVPRRYNDNALFERFWFSSDIFFTLHALWFDGKTTLFLNETPHV